jgi:cytochrome b subunit of formate dehydrogenase
LLAGHIAFALYNSESLRGIIFGAVDEKWAEEHYPTWFEQETGTK